MWAATSPLVSNRSLKREVSGEQLPDDRPMDKPRANTATAHKLVRMVYFMLTRGEKFVDSR